MGVATFGPAAAIESVTGIPTDVNMLLIIGICTIYTSIVGHHGNRCTYMYIKLVYHSPVKYEFKPYFKIYVQAWMYMYLLINTSLLVFVAPREASKLSCGQISSRASS